jgi:cytoskeletal protein RodZ
MAQYEQKTEGREFKVANPDRHRGSWSGDAPAPTDIAIRLWGLERSGRATLTWKADSVLVYMIADLVDASRGRIAEETLPVMAAHFDCSSQALLAARRIQTSILEFLACRPGDRVGGAIIIYVPRTTDPTGLSGEMVRQELRHAMPGQILLAANVSQRLRDLPGIEFVTVSALTGMSDGSTETGLTELVWTTPERVALLRASVGDWSEPQAPDSPDVGATRIVDSPFARPERANASAPPVVHTNDFVMKDSSEAQSLRAAHVLANAQNWTQLSPDLEDSPGSSSGEAAEFEEQPLFTRTRVILGLVALVLVAALIAVLFRPRQLTRGPLPPPQDQAAGPASPEIQPPVPPKPETRTAETRTSETKTPKLEPAEKPAAKGSAAVAKPQPPAKPSVGNRVKSPTEAGVEPEIYHESGGFTARDVPQLLKMAQTDAGAGNYAQAKREYQKVLSLQPNNQDAKDGLRKLDLIPTDQQ